MSKFIIEKQECSDIVILQLKLCEGNKSHICDGKNDDCKVSNRNPKRRRSACTLLHFRESTCLLHLTTLSIADTTQH